MCFTINTLEIIVDAVHILDYLLYTTSILLCVMLYVMYLFVLFVLQADMYRKDFESERYDHTRLADQMNKSQVQQVLQRLYMYVRVIML